MRFAACECQFELAVPLNLIGAWSYLVAAGWHPHQGREQKPTDPAQGHIHDKKKTGAGEGIRTLDPNLGKIQPDEIYIQFQTDTRVVKNPNMIRRLLIAYQFVFKTFS